MLLSPLHLINNKIGMPSLDFYKALVAFSFSFMEIREYNPHKPQHFASGLPFAIMLADCESIDIDPDEIDHKSPKWIVKVSNLKKILTKVQIFYDKRMISVEKLSDIDVVEIAKHHSEEHISKFFEVVMTVLLASERKQHYVEIIMGLEEGIQKTFVEIIKRTKMNEQAIAEQNRKMVEFQEEIKQLKRENMDLKDEVSQFARKNRHLQRQVKDLRDKLINYQQELEMKETTDHSLASDDLQLQNDKQKMLIQNLKIKLLTTVRQGQFQLTKLREEISGLKLKCENMEEMESNLEQYKQLYNQALAELQKMNDVQREKRRLIKMIEDKDAFIKTLQNRFQGQKIHKQDEKKEKTKKDQPQKNIKRLKSEPAQIQPDYQQFTLAEDQRDEIFYLEEELTRARSRIKQFQKENIKNRKKFDKLLELQREKKRLQRVISEVNKSKDAEIQMLVTSLYDLRDENIKMFEMLSQQGMFKKNVA